eukprot:8565206-Pyramimonas_sp.AAC.1
MRILCCVPQSELTSVVVVADSYGWVEGVAEFGGRPGCPGALGCLEVPGGARRCPGEPGCPGARVS